MYDQQNQALLDLISEHVGLNKGYLDKANLLVFITNKNNHVAVKTAVLKVCNMHKINDDRKRHFINYLNVLIKGS